MTVVAINRGNLLRLDSTSMGRAEIIFVSSGLDGLVNTIMTGRASSSAGATRHSSSLSPQCLNVPAAEHVDTPGDTSIDCFSFITLGTKEKHFGIK